MPQVRQNQRIRSTNGRLRRTFVPIISRMTAFWMITSSVSSSSSRGPEIRPSTFHKTIIPNRRTETRGSIKENPAHRTHSRLTGDSGEAERLFRGKANGIPG
jgi:hypothetical protein